MTRDVGGWAVGDCLGPCRRGAGERFCGRAKLESTFAYENAQLLSLYETSSKDAEHIPQTVADHDLPHIDFSSDGLFGSHEWRAAKGRVGAKGSRGWLEV